MRAPGGGLLDMMYGKSNKEWGAREAEDENWQTRLRTPKAMVLIAQWVRRVGARHRSNAVFNLLISRDGCVHFISRREFCCTENVWTRTRSFAHYWCLC